MATEERKSVIRPTFRSEASRASVTTEHLALIGFTARLGTCVNNDAENGKAAKSVRDEAMLLMSLLTGKKASEILSEEVGVNEASDEGRKKYVRPKDRDMGNFSFVFPSLSLQPDAAAATPSPSPVAGEGGSADKLGDHDEAADLPPPSKLLSRTQSITDKDDIRASSEHMAHNVLDSFGAALQWRAKTWIKSLAHVLALKEEQRLQEAAAANGKGGQGGSDQRDSAPSTPKNNEDLMNSREMQIIDAIVKSSEDVVVVNLKTSFRVAPHRIHPREGDSPDTNLEPDRKKIKPDPNEYKVRHRLIFEAIVTMTSNDGGRYKTVRLQAPGVIEGTFVMKNDSSVKEETLTGVSLELDTDALALSLERQSRLVVRKAAEATLVAASGIESGAMSPARYTDSPHVHHSVISPRYILMSPIPTQPYISDYEDDLKKADLSFPVLTDPKVEQEPLTQESRDESSAVAPIISDDNGSGSDSSAAPFASAAKIVKPTAHTPQSPSFPALLSVANSELTRGE
ncbi:hypothetical protein ACHAWT_010804 [Skeletonema menzelii]|mmetsp:Transcript_25656/g.42360  ORF Transcript_25656/g.42360 Transcript_25656/m.42360 type:complete len:514 (-) Transcript_25656:265-1806(-)|eukprot:scaffold484_cov148-Skeletonema_menzelii.AAC.5